MLSHSVLEVNSTEGRWFIDQILQRSRQEQRGIQPDPAVLRQQRQAQPVREARDEFEALGAHGSGRIFRFSGAEEMVKCVGRPR